MARTPYAETEFVLAVMEEREDDAQRIASDMTPTERALFSGQLQAAQEILFDAGQA